MRHLAGARCVVVGGAGSIGSHVAEALLEQRASVLIFDQLTTGRRILIEELSAKGATYCHGDIRDQESVQSSFEGADFIFHLAAAWMNVCQQDPAVALQTNTVGTFNVLQAAAAAGARKVVFSSAGAVYGEPRSLPIDEDHPLAATTHYGVSKIAGEKMADAYHASHGLAYVALRYFNVYGPRHDHHGNSTQVVPRWLGELDVGSPPIIYGDGLQTMDFVYVLDVARANLLAAASDAVGPYNVASGKETSANELADLLAELTGTHIRAIHQGVDTAAVRRRLGSTERARQDLGFQASIDLETGLRETINWRRAG